MVEPVALSRPAEERGAWAQRKRRAGEEVGLENDLGERENGRGKAC